MDDPLSVCLADRIARLNHAGNGFSDRQSPTRPGKVLLEIRAAEVLHHHVGRSRFESAHVAHTRDVLTLDLGGRASLARKSFDSLPAVERLWAQKLESHLLIEVNVRGCGDDTHPSGTEDAFHPELASDQLAYLDFQLVAHRSPPGTIH